MDGWQVLGDAVDEDGTGGSVLAAHECLPWHNGGCPGRRREGADLEAVIQVRPRTCARARARARVCVSEAAVVRLSECRLMSYACMQACMAAG